jgi:hypothetical protein
LKFFFFFVSTRGASRAVNILGRRSNLMQNIHTFGRVQSATLNTHASPRQVVRHLTGSKKLDAIPTEAAIVSSVDKAAVEKSARDQPAALDQMKNKITAFSSPAGSGATSEAASHLKTAASVAILIGGGVLASNFIPFDTSKVTSGSQTPAQKGPLFEKDYQRYADYVSYDEYEKMIKAFEAMPKQVLELPYQWPEDVQRMVYLYRFHQEQRRLQMLREHKLVAASDAAFHAADSLKKGASDQDVSDQASISTVGTIKTAAKAGWQKLVSVIRSPRVNSDAKPESQAIPAAEPKELTFEESFQKDGDRGTSLDKLVDMISFLDARMRDDESLRKSQFDTKLISENEKAGLFVIFFFFSNLKFYINRSYVHRRDNVVRASRSVAAKIAWS